MKGTSGTDCFRHSRDCGQEALSIVPIGIMSITNINLTASAHGSTRNAHQEPKPMPILDRINKQHSPGLWPWKPGGVWKD